MICIIFIIILILILIGLYIINKNTITKNKNKITEHFYDNHITNVSDNHITNVTEETLFGYLIKKYNIKETNNVLLRPFDTKQCSTNTDCIYQCNLMKNYNKCKDSICKEKKCLTPVEQTSYVLNKDSYIDITGIKSYDFYINMFFTIKKSEQNKQINILESSKLNWTIYLENNKISIKYMTGITGDGDDQSTINTKEIEINYDIKKDEVYYLKVYTSEKKLNIYIYDINLTELEYVKDIDIDKITCDDNNDDKCIYKNVEFTIIPNDMAVGTGGSTSNIKQVRLHNHNNDILKCFKQEEQSENHDLKIYFGIIDIDNENAKCSFENDDKSYNNTIICKNACLNTKNCSPEYCESKCNTDDLCKPESFNFNESRHSLDCISKCISPTNTNKDKCTNSRCKELCEECGDNCPWNKNDLTLDETTSKNIDINSAPPSAKLKLHNSFIDGKKVHFKWTNLNQYVNINGYICYVYKTFKKADGVQIYRINKCSTNWCDYILEDLDTDETYSVAIKGFNNFGLGDISNIVTFKPKIKQISSDFSTNIDTSKLKIGNFNLCSDPDINNDFKPEMNIIMSL